jgi:hypothetical protein
MQQQTIHKKKLETSIALNSHGRVVGRATGYSLEQRNRNSSLCRVKNFTFPISSTPAMRSTQPPIQWVPGVSYSEVNRQGR